MIEKIEEKTKKEEEIIELYPDETPKQTFDDIIKQENTLNRPLIINSIMRGATITAGSGNSCFKFDKAYGLWLGNASYASAPFKVDMAGVLTCAGANIRGTLNADDITDGTLAVERLGDGTITSVKVKPSLRGSSHDLVFSATDADTVAWASGDIILSDGTKYDIDAGNTGNMSARTYIYLDIDTSETVLQTSTTFSDAVGENKILIASAENGTTEATFYVIGGIGGINLDADNIIANTLSVISADMGSITAGNITLDSSGYIKGGQTAYDTGTGFFLGYDTDTYKFSLGDPSGNYLTWNGSILSISGALIGAKVYRITDDVYHSDDDMEGGNFADYTEVKEFTLPADFPTQNLRIYFELATDSPGAGNTAFGRIYKNDVAFGTERTNDGINYEGFSEDLEFTGGDTIQLMIKQENTPDRTTRVQNFRVLGTNIPSKFTITTTS